MNGADHYPNAADKIGFDTTRLYMNSTNLHLESKRLPKEQAKLLHHPCSLPSVLIFVYKSRNYNLQLHN